MLFIQLICFMRMRWIFELTKTNQDLQKWKKHLSKFTCRFRSTRLILIIVISFHISFVWINMNIEIDETLMKCNKFERKKKHTKEYIRPGVVLYNVSVENVFFSFSNWSLRKAIIRRHYNALNESNTKHRTVFLNMGHLTEKHRSIKNCEWWWESNGQRIAWRNEFVRIHCSQSTFVFFLRFDSFRSFLFSELFIIGHTRELKIVFFIWMLAYTWLFRIYYVVLL